MRTVITSSGDSQTSEFDKRFGRAAWFCLYDDATGEKSFYRNENLNASSGAGTKTAEKMVEWKVDKVISGDFGPKAKDLLDKFNIQMVILQEDNPTIEEIISKLKK